MSLSTSNNVISTKEKKFRDEKNQNNIIPVQIHTVKYYICY